MRMQLVFGAPKLLAGFLLNGCLQHKPTPAHIFSCVHTLVLFPWFPIWCVHVYVTAQFATSSQLWNWLAHLKLASLFWSWPVGLLRDVSYKCMWAHFHTHISRLYCLAQLLCVAATCKLLADGTHLEKWNDLNNFWKTKCQVLLH